MLDLGRSVLDLEIRKRVRPAPITNEQRVALRVIPRAACLLGDLDEPAICVLPMPGRDALRDDGALRVLAQVDHLRTGVRLLVVVRRRYRVELAHRVVALQDAPRILPGDRGAGLDLRPRDLRLHAEALAPLRDEVVNPALSFFVAGIPVLYGRVLDRRVIERNQLDHGRVQLVLVAHRRRATFEIAHERAFLGDDECSLELAGVLRVDPEVGRQLHRTPHALGDVGERAVTEDRRVERREEIVGVRHDRAEVLAHELRMALDGFREGTEDDAELGELLLERGRH